MADPILFWHRRDLRITDNVGLFAARQRSPKVVGCFCLDPKILQRDDTAAVRVTYLMGCLGHLQKAYQRAGSQLLILQGDPLELLPPLAQQLNAPAVFWNKDVEPYSRQRDQSVSQALQELGIEVQAHWDQLLHAPGDILTGAGAFYSVFTPFWRNWSQKPKAQPLPSLQDAIGLTDDELRIAQGIGAASLPSARDLGFHWQGTLILEPGEQAAQTCLDTFCQNALEDYALQRNFPAQSGTSQLSPALKLGAIGIRSLWAAAQTMAEQCRSDEARASIQTWQQELAWREFYQHALFYVPALADGPYRSVFQAFPWQNREDQFQAWCDGHTGYPIVDAAMRQLKETGWMHNRCRMIVASFLTKDLIIDWRWGEKYFMQHLIDGDLASNNGGWQWSASSGMDPRPLRIFNPASQAQKFDANADYIRQWLPELQSVDTESLVTGKLSPLDRHRCGYPPAIVDHYQQQQRFKDLYNHCKGLG